MANYVTSDQIKNNHEAIVSAIASGERVRLTRDHERQLGAQSTFFLARHIFEYPDLTNQFHLGLCTWFDRHLGYNQLHLHPRKHFKSTLINVTSNARMALIDPNYTCCIISSVMDNSQMFLGIIKNHFIHNEKFRALYPEHAVHKSKQEGTQKSFTTPARTNFRLGVGTFDAASLDKTVVSRHYMKLIFDDPMDDQNSETADQRQKAQDRFATMLATTSIRGKLPWHDVIGTRWDFDDLYQWILDRNERTPIYKILITKARRYDEDGNCHILFPERFSKEYLDFLENEFMGKYRFSCLYQNDPVPEGESDLDFAKVALLDGPGEYKKLRGDSPVRRVVTVDPSGADPRERDCPHVITVSEIDREGNIYIREINRGWWNPDVFVDRMCTVAQNWGVRKVGFEKVSLSKIYIFYLEKAIKDKHLYLQVIPLTRDSRVSKNDRIKRIIPFLNKGKIHVMATDPNLDILQREMREFPRGRFKDILDTIADAVEMLKAPARNVRSTAPYRIPPRTYSSRTNIQTGYNYMSGGHTPGEEDSEESAYARFARGLES